MPPGGKPQHLAAPGVLPQQLGEVLTPRKQAVVDRLRRRIENYRRRQTDFMPRFDQTFNGLCEQNIQETLLLKQKFLENKAKRTAKKQDKKQSEIPNNIQNNLFAQQKFLKRSADDLDGPGEYGDSGPKLQCGGGGGGGGASGGNSGTGGGQPGSAPRPKEGLTKFSVEIVQQLEFTTSETNSQPQQISTNVTVKALTNASVKSDMGNTSSPKATAGAAGAADCSSQSSAPNSGQRTSNCVDLRNLVECKQEPDSDFVDLEQCAAALEKDAQNNGASFPGFSEFIGDEGGDEIITSDAFKDLISEISDFHPEFMKDFDFDEHKPNINALANSLSESSGNAGGNNVVTSITTTNQMKVEGDSKNIQIHQQHMIDVGKRSANGVQYPGAGQYDPNGLAKSRIPAYGGLEFGKAELSPAAQTLKQMAEQHQHKTQLGMGFPAGRNPRSPYGEYQFGSNGDCINSPGSTNAPPSSGQFINKNIPPPSSSQNFQNQSTNTGNGQSLPDVKQEVMFSATQTQNFQVPAGPGNLEMQKRMQAMHQQQMSGQAQSPQAPKTPTNPAMMGAYKQQYSPYGSPGGHGSPGYMPRGGQGSAGPFGPGSAPSRPSSVPAGATTLQMSQAEQMQITQQNSGQQIQVSAGQHMQLTGDLKPNVSITAQQQQAMFIQQSDSYSPSMSQSINFTQQNMRGRGVGPVPRPEQQHLIQQQQQQQQQMIRAQQQQMGLRPPPPEYKPSQPQMIHSMSQQRFPPGAMRRPGPGQQPMPPSGPMMRPQHPNVFIGNSGMGRELTPGGYMPRQRPPNVSVGPDGMPMSNRGGPEWRHIIMSQHQNMGFSHVRPYSTNQGNFTAVQNNPTGMQMHPQRRPQLPPGATGQMQIIPQDQQVGSIQGQSSNSNQMSVNLQMTQSQSMSLSTGMANSHHPHMHHMTPGSNSHFQFNNNSGFPTNSFGNGSGGPTSSGTQTTGNMNNGSISGSGGVPGGGGGGSISGGGGGGGNSSSSTSNNNSNQTTNDFGFEFLDSLPGDPPFSAQDLLNSLDSASNFNLNDIL